MVAAQGSLEYETDEARELYLALHYPAADLLRPFLGAAAPPLSDRYPHCVRRLWEPAPGAVALDVGCACGAVALALARDHAAAIGLDRSRTLVRAAAEVARTGLARYRLPVEGEIAHAVEVPVETAANVRFLQGDALALPFRNGAFATVLALNLIDRVLDPARALNEAARVTAEGGILIVGSPYTWLPSYAPRERWLGGTIGPDGRERRGAEGVRAVLGPRFCLEREESRPFFIPHHARSGQLGLAHLQRFRRIS